MSSVCTLDPQVARHDSRPGGNRSGQCVLARAGLCGPQQSAVAGRLAPQELQPEVCALVQDCGKYCMRTGLLDPTWLGLHLMRLLLGLTALADGHAVRSVSRVSIAGR